MRNDSPARDRNRRVGRSDSPLIDDSERTGFFVSPRHRDPCALMVLLDFIGSNRE